MFYNYDGTRKKLLIFGTGSLAKLAYHYFSTDSDYDIHAFCEEPYNITVTNLYGLPVIPFAQALRHYPQGEYTFFVALDVPDNWARRKEQYLRVKAAGYALASYVSSHASILNLAFLGENSLIMELAAIQPEVRIGNNVIVGCGSIVAYGAHIDDHCFLNAGTRVASESHIGEESFTEIDACIPAQSLSLAGSESAVARKNSVVQNLER